MTLEQDLDNARKKLRDVEAEEERLYRKDSPGERPSPWTRMAAQRD